MNEREFYDGSSLLLRACEKAEAEPPRVPTIFYGFAEMNALQRRLAAAVCREAQSQALAPAETDAPACACMRNPLSAGSRRWVFKEKKPERLSRGRSRVWRGRSFSDDGRRSLWRKTPCGSWRRPQKAERPGRRAGKCYGRERILRAMMKYAS